MKFGKVENPSLINFELPQNHSSTIKVLGGNPLDKTPGIYVGCAKWNRKDLKGFYPRGTKDELQYYANQFNSIELNATFYGMPSVEQIIKWRDKTPKGFKFFPKLTNTISHYRRLINVEDIVTQYVSSIIHFEEKLGMAFLQMHQNFTPKNFNRLVDFVKTWPKEIPLSIELRNEEWFSEPIILDEVCDLFRQYGITNMLVDTAGRRDMLHMKLTTNTAFIRYVGANIEADYTRIDDWVERLTEWKNQGLEEVYFFVHQNIEEASPLLSAYFIEKLNEKWNVNLKKPILISQQTLF